VTIVLRRSQIVLQRRRSSRNDGRGAPNALAPSLSYHRAYGSHSIQLPFGLYLVLLRLCRNTPPTEKKLPPRELAGSPAPPRPPAHPRRRPGPVSRLEVEILQAEEGPVVRLRGEASVLEASVLATASGDMLDFHWDVQHVPDSLPDRSFPSRP